MQAMGMPARSLNWATLFLALRTTAFWPGDGGQFVDGHVQDLDVLDGVADAHVDDDLLQAGHLHGGGEAEFLLELRRHLLAHSGP